MKALIGYESRGGHTKRAADAVAAAVRAAGGDVEIAPLSAIGPDSVEAADVVFVGTWTEGFILVGVGPARAAKRWASALPKLDGKPVAVFCTYGFNPKDTLEALGGILESKGATVVASNAAHGKHPSQGVEAFVSRALATVKT